MTNMRHIHPALRQMVQQSLGKEEFERRLQQPTDPEEEQANLELIRWFIRRYPTPQQRSMYIKRKMKSWTAGHNFDE